MAKKQQVARQMQYPEPPSGIPKQSGNQGYPEPTGGPIQYGLNLSSHNTTYPQPNSPSAPDQTSTAPPGIFPGPEAYRPNIAGNPTGASVSIPGVIHGDEPPNLSSNDVD